MSRDRLLGALLLAPVVGALCFSAVRFVAEGGDVPDDADYDAAAAFFDAAGVSADDAIAVLPPWSVRPLQHFGRHSGRVVASDGPWVALTRHRYGRLFVVVEPDAEPWLRAANLPAPSSSRAFGHLRIDEYDAESDAGSTGAAVDLRALVENGSAHVDVDGAVCTDVIRGGVRCDQTRVLRNWALVTENGSDVISARPVKGGTLTIAFDDVRLGSNLVVAAGHTRDGAERGQATVHIAVKIDDAVVATLDRAPSFVVEPSRAALRDLFVDHAAGSAAVGFRADVVDTAAFAGSAHRVAFVITADGDGGDFAFDAFVPRSGK